MKRILLLTSFSERASPGSRFPTTSVTTTSPAASAAMTASTSTRMGEAIRLQCTLCHALPQVVRDERQAQRGVHRKSRPYAAAQSQRAELHARSPLEGRRHLHDVPRQDRVGTEGGNFCSNPACHGRKWPEMNLDAQAGANRNQTLMASRRTPRKLRIRLQAEHGRRWKSANPSLWPIGDETFDLIEAAEHYRSSCRGAPTLSCSRAQQHGIGKNHSRLSRHPVSFDDPESKTAARIGWRFISSKGRSAVLKASGA